MYHTYDTLHVSYKVSKLSENGGRELDDPVLHKGGSCNPSHQWADQGSLYYYNSEIATSAMVKADQGRAINGQTRAGRLLAMKSKPPSKDVYGDKLHIYSGMYCTILLCAIILYGKRFKTLHLMTKCSSEEFSQSSLLWSDQKKFGFL